MFMFLISIILFFSQAGYAQQSSAPTLTPQIAAVRTKPAPVTLGPDEECAYEYENWRRLPGDFRVVEKNGVSEREIISWIYRISPAFWRWDCDISEREGVAICGTPHEPIARYRLSALLETESHTAPDLVPTKLMNVWLPNGDLVQIGERGTNEDRWISDHRFPIFHASGLMVPIAGTWIAPEAPPKNSDTLTTSHYHRIKHVQLMGEVPTTVGPPQAWYVDQDMLYEWVNAEERFIPRLRFSEPTSARHDRLYDSSVSRWSSRDFRTYGGLISERSADANTLLVRIDEYLKVHGTIYIRVTWDDNLGYLFFDQEVQYWRIWAFNGSSIPSMTFNLCLTGQNNQGMLNLNYAELPEVRVLEREPEGRGLRYQSGFDWFRASGMKDVTSELLVPISPEEAEAIVNARIGKPDE